MLAGGDDGFAVGSPAIETADIEVRAEFGGDDQPVALLATMSDVVADDLFRVTLGATVGGIDEIAAKIKVVVEDGLASLTLEPQPFGLFSSPWTFKLQLQRRMSLLSPQCRSRAF